MKISSLLNEAEKTNSGAAMALPIDKDLIYKAKNKYPGYSPEQAMILLISDEMKNQAKTDSTQNTLIVFFVVYLKKKHLILKKIR